MTREEKITKVIEIISDSLASHLDYAHQTETKKASLLKAHGSKKFHQKCVKEYAEAIKLLSELL